MSRRSFLWAWSLSAFLGMILCNTSRGADLAKVFNQLSILSHEAMLEEADSKIRFDTFIFSTEIEIGKAQSIIDESPGGGVFSFGSEIAFKTLAMDKRATFGIFVDLDENITRFNVINSQLLKAKTLDHYKHLRWGDSNFEDWGKLSEKLSVDDFEWWQKNVKDMTNDKFSYPEELNRDEAGAAVFPSIHVFYKICTSNVQQDPNQHDKYLEDLNKCLLEIVRNLENNSQQISARELAKWQRVKSFEGWEKWLSFLLMDDPSKLLRFKKGNYLFDEELYARLHKLAVDEKIHAIRGNLKNKDFLAKFTALLRESNLFFGLLNLDNVYFRMYLGAESFANLIKQVRPIVQDSSVLLLMTNSSELPSGPQLQTYFGFTYEYYEKMGYDFNFGDYLSRIDKYPSLLNNMDGLVFSLKNSLPYGDIWKVIFPSPKE